MAIDTWGDKPKSQIDNSTVDEEIDAKINDHLADADAHLESGQSLQSHKASEIIDHIVGSVVADKLSNTEFYGSTIFESLVGWHDVGTVTNDDFPGCIAYVEYGAVNISSCYTQPQVPANFFDDTVNMLVQTMQRFVFSNSHFYGWLGYVQDETASADGFGFQIRDGALYAHVSYNSVDHNDLISGVDLSQDNVFRAQYTATTRLVEFFVNGALVDSYTIGSGNYWSTDLGPAFGVKLTQENDGNLFLGILSFSRQI